MQVKPSADLLAESMSMPVGFEPTSPLAVDY